VNGRRIVEWNDGQFLHNGTHHFRVTLSDPGAYILTAHQNGRNSSVKMVNKGKGGENAIIHVGSIDDDGSGMRPLKSGRDTSSYLFHSGDIMRYIGYAVVDGEVVESEVVECQQLGSEVIPLQFNVDCPEVVTRTVTDIAFHNATLHGEVSLTTMLMWWNGDSIGEQEAITPKTTPLINPSMDFFSCYTAYFWSATQNVPGAAYYRSLTYNSACVGRWG